MHSIARACLGFLIAWTAASNASAQDRPPPADPLEATIDVSDVQRFATLWKKTGGKPTAAQIDAEYLKGGGTGVKLFIPARALSGEVMAKAIAEDRALYEQALDKCLPWVADSTSDLRAIYLGLHGLLPEKPLPQIYMVIARANTGGTAAPGAQLLGLEILCREGPTPQKFRELLRTFFAHETAHTFQQSIGSNPKALADPLLAVILHEGVADYVASLVTGASANVPRDEYGRAHEAELWLQFLKDRTLANAHFKDGFDKVGREAQGHWLYNGRAGKLPGWETDMGYWLGMRIAQAYVEHSADRHAAVRELLALDDPAELLRKSGYAGKP